MVKDCSLLAQRASTPTDRNRAKLDETHANLMFLYISQSHTIRTNCEPFRHFKELTKHIFSCRSAPSSSGRQPPGIPNRMSGDPSKHTNISVPPQNKGVGLSRNPAGFDALRGVGPDTRIIGLKR